MRIAHARTLGAVERERERERGITLIALVVTIVVLLILAGISINAVLGDNGLISRAKDAKEKTEQDQVNTEKGMNNLYDEMMGILGENGGNAGNGEDSGSGNTGNGGNAEGGEVSNWDDILADANANPDSYKHEETLTSEYIAIGTDGQPVNMDLWNPTKNADGTFSLGNSSTAYNNSNNIYAGSYDGGVIEGMVPQYIYNTDTSTFKPVVTMCATFCCSVLEKAPKIPETVTSVYGLFAYCRKLTEAPSIPNGVTDMSYTFYYCESLTEAPEIPNGVTNMYVTFYYCSSLTGTITINANPTKYNNCFSGTVKPITLTNSATATETATLTTLNNLTTETGGNVTVVPAQ